MADAIRLLKTSEPQKRFYRLPFVLEPFTVDINRTCFVEDLPHLHADWFAGRPYRQCKLEFKFFPIRNANPFIKLRINNKFAPTTRELHGVENVVQGVVIILTHCFCADQDRQL